MAIYYLDVDDEITSAAARIRDSSETRIALVIQGGSRVATSRINFKVLAREARHRNRRLAIVAADATVRSLAQSAGLPVFGSVSEYQKAESARPAGTQPGGADAVSDTLDELAATVYAARTGPTVPARGLAAGSLGGATRSVAEPPRAGFSWHGIGLRGIVAIALVAVLIVVGGTAFTVLPSASIVLTLRGEPVGPLNLTVTVDPSLTTNDDATATIAGESKSFDLQSSGSFQATGQRIVETAATGTVTFMSANTDHSVNIPAGTQIETAGKIAFATTATVNVPKATLSGVSTLTLGRADAPVVAVKKGVSGNVAAGAIVNVPPALAVALVTPNQVTNKAPTTGGTHTVVPFIQQSDIDAAEASLTSQLDSSLQAQAADPASANGGLEIFPKTAQMGDATYSPDPGTLLNQETGNFELAASATGTATAADLASVRSLSQRRIMGLVKPGYTVVAGSVEVALGSPANQGSVISVPVTANAMQAPKVDEAKLRDAIKGMSVTQARSYLSKYGVAEVSLSPFWSSTVTGLDFRIDMRVISPTPGPTAASTPTAHPTPRPTPRPTLPARSPSPTPALGATPTPTAGPTAPTPTPVPTATPTPQASPTATP
jgi:hypothetical protein